MNIFPTLELKLYVSLQRIAMISFVLEGEVHLSTEQ